MSDDLTRLREIAEAVNRDNWRSDYRDVFIATFDPPTVTALIDRAERAERERDRLAQQIGDEREAFKRATAHYADSQNTLRSDLTALRAAVTGLADEWDAKHHTSPARARGSSPTLTFEGAAYYLRALLTDEGDNG